MNWIACNDQMPEAEELVVFIYSGYRVRIGNFNNEDDTWIMETFASQVNFLDDIDDHLVDRDEVTHWLPLPEPPKP